jgi:hypothetical protein
VVGVEDHRSYQVEVGVQVGQVEGEDLEGQEVVEVGGHQSLVGQGVVEVDQVEVEEAGHHL